MKKCEAIQLLAERYRIADSRCRAGQAIFNAARSLFPSEAHRWRGSDIDPSYRDERIAAFLAEFDEEMPLGEEVQDDKASL